MFYSESQNSLFLTMSKVKMGHILPKRKNGTTNFFEYSKVHLVCFISNAYKQRLVDVFDDLSNSTG